MNPLTPFAQFIRQALLYPLYSPFLPPVSKVEKDFSYSAGQLKGTLEAGVAGLPRTGQTESYQDYDDGYYEAGLPAGEGTRFIDNLDNTITDSVTGLDWIQNEAIVSGNGFDFSGVYYGADAINAITAMNAESYAGHDDWRLPNVKELMSIVDYGRYSPSIDPIFTSISGPYWSSTDFSDAPNSAWAVFFITGEVDGGPKNYNANYVRAVRGGQLNP